MNIYSKTYHQTIQTGDQEMAVMVQQANGYQNFCQQPTITAISP